MPGEEWPSSRSQDGAGMPVEAFVQTGDRTMISYLSSRCMIN